MPRWPGQLRVIPEAMLKAIAAALDRENELTVGHIQAQHLTGHGPFPVEEHKLGVVTNRLRSSVRPELATIQEATSKAPSAAMSFTPASTRGIDKMVGVRAFTRHDSRGDVFAQAPPRASVARWQDHPRAESAGLRQRDLERARLPAPHAHAGPSAIAPAWWNAPRTTARRSARRFYPPGRVGRLMSSDPLRILQEDCYARLLVEPGLATIAILLQRKAVTTRK